jgi:hypothetical protein
MKLLDRFSTGDNATSEDDSNQERCEDGDHHLVIKKPGESLESSHVERDGLHLVGFQQYTVSCTKCNFETIAERREREATIPVDWNDVSGEYGYVTPEGDPLPIDD